LKYSLIADIYEKIEATTKRLEMTDYLVELIRNTSKEDIDKVIYLTQGKVYPDYMGIELGIAEKLAIKSIAIATGKAEKAVEEDYKKTGDLGETAANMLARKAQLTLFKEPLTVGMVYDALVKISRETGPGSIDAKVRLLCSLLNNATPKEAKYLLRTALGKLRLGVADMTILDALSIVYGGGKETREHLERAYNLSSDLGHVAKTVAYHGLEGIKKFKVTIGRPIRPMLAERLSNAKEILEKLGGKGAAEYKYDGLRVQAHVSPDRIYLFSRRLENITDQFPDVSNYLRESIKAKEAVVEGECVAVDANTGDMLPFQMISQRRGRKYEIEKMAEEIPVVVFLFDLLYADGEDYTLHPYPERREALKKITEESEHVKISEQLVTDDPAELDRYMDKAISEGCEGLMLKSIGPDSTYQAGARGWIWIKYKREYKSEMTDTVDLVVVGAFHGKGKRAGTYGALLLASYDEENDIFRTVCKCGSGFTDEDLAKIPKMLEPYKIPHRHARVDSKLTPDVWFTPSIVLEIIGAEITLSPVHTCCMNAIRPGSGLAIRFPRFTGNYRLDKAPEDANTAREIMEMYRSQLKQIQA
jgi:DNA ligase-1